jgi:hypothetical protein
MSNKARTDDPRAKAMDWARGKIVEYFESERGYTPMTAGDLLHLLDQQIDSPCGWQQLQDADSTAYRHRYAIVRNTLEVLARQKKLVIGSTVNAKGKDNSATYSRPRDASADWNVGISATSGSADHRVRQRVNEWLSFDDGTLHQVNEIHLVRKGVRFVKSSETKAQEPFPAPGRGDADQESPPKKRRGRPPGSRNRRTTQGGD